MRPVFVEIIHGDKHFIKQALERLLNKVELVSMIQTVSYPQNELLITMTVVYYDPNVA